MNQQNSMSDRLRSRRNELGLSKAELARRANICHTIVSKIENGKHIYSRYAFDLADALEVNVDWLVRGRQPKAHVRMDNAKG